MFVSITDQLNNSINVSFPPKRIVSLVPSITELLYDLGLYEEVIGITKFCIHPEIWFRSKQRIGGTKTVNIDLVKNLLPDLIIANKEENVKEQVDELRLIAPVYVSNINTLEEALEMINSIGKLVDKQTKAKALAAKIEKAFQQLIPVKQTVNTAYFIWKNPYMAAGGDTFINDMLDRCGFINILKDLKRYPEVSISNFSISNTRQSKNNSTSVNIPPSSVNFHLSTDTCQLLLLSSEPYPFKQKHLEELQPELPECKIMLVDGEMFSWYGSRLVHAVSYFKNLISQIQG